MGPLFLISSSLNPRYNNAWNGDFFLSLLHLIFSFDRLRISVKTQKYNIYEMRLNLHTLKTGTLTTLTKKQEWTKKSFAHLCPDLKNV